MSAFDDLLIRWEANKGKGLGKSIGKTKEIAINKLEVDPDVFQPRYFDDDSTGINSRDHVADLVKRLEREGALDSILVLPMGDKAIVIDGHHRLEAYRKAKKEKINVLVFSDDPQAARLASAHENHKIRLPMSLQERNQSAWKLVKEGKVPASSSKWIYSENQIKQATGASEGTIKNMRTIYKGFVEKDIDPPDSWITARNGDAEILHRDWNAELEIQVERFRKGLYKAVPKLDTSYKREAFAMAVVSFSPGSTIEILRYILGTDEGQDAIERMREDEEDDDQELDF